MPSAAALQSANHRNHESEYDVEKQQMSPSRGLLEAWDRFASRSVLIRSVPWAIVSAGVSLFCTGIRNDDKLSKFSTAIKNPFAVQVFGIMFAFLITSRVTRAIGRWWDGLDTVNQMYRCLYNAFSFIMLNVGKEQKMMEIQLARTDLSNEDVAWIRNRLNQLEDFSHKIIHWFSLMNALALGQLKYGERQCLQHIECKSADFAQLTRQSSKEKMENNTDRRCSKMDAVRHVFEGGQETAASLTYLGEMSPEELKLLNNVEDKMQLCAQFIMQAILIADSEKILDIAPPILNRVYIRLEDSLQHYLGAFNLAAVPYPYPLAQMMRVLMYSFVFMMPVIIEQFTGTGVLTPALSFLIVVCYWGLDRVARELENPFGEDANDLPLHDFCANFNDTIQQMCVVQVQNHEDLDQVYTFSEMYTPGNNRMPLKKPAALSNPPVPAPEKMAAKAKAAAPSDALWSASDKMADSSKGAADHASVEDQAKAAAPCNTPGSASGEMADSSKAAADHAPIGDKARAAASSDIYTAGSASGEMADISKAAAGHALGEDMDSSNAKGLRQAEQAEQATASSKPITEMSQITSSWLSHVLGIPAQGQPDITQATLVQVAPNPQSRPHPIATSGGHTNGRQLQPVQRWPANVCLSGMQHPKPPQGPQRKYHTHHTGQQIFTLQQQKHEHQACVMPLHVEQGGWVPNTAFLPAVGCTEWPLEDDATQKLHGKIYPEPVSSHWRNASQQQVWQDPLELPNVIEVLRNEEDSTRAVEEEYAINELCLTNFYSPASTSNPAGRASPWPNHSSQHSQFMTGQPVQTVEIQSRQCASTNKIQPEHQASVALLPKPTLRQPGSALSACSQDDYELS